MPEGPEVLLTSQMLDVVMRRKKLYSVDIISGRYQNKKPPGYDSFLKKLPMKIKCFKSKGKFMWIILEDKNKKEWFIWNTFGLSGAWTFEETNHTRIIFRTKKSMMCYNDVRNFGTLKFSDDYQDLKKKLKTIAPDFLKSDKINMNKILTLNWPIVKILMDQNKIGSGIGNYLSSEILYRAKISPHRLGNSLSKKELKKLYTSIIYVMKLAYMNNNTGYMNDLDDKVKCVEKKNYHPEIKIKNKKFEFKVYGKKIDPHSNAIVKDKIVGSGSTKRTTYWTPNIQS